MNNHIFLATDYQVIGDGKTDNSKSLNKVIANIDQLGGGTLILSPGEYLTGSLKLCSNLTLQIDAGATLSFINDVAAYPVVNSRWEGAKRDVYRACLYGNDIQNVTLTGKGMVEGNGAFWWKLFKSEKIEYPRPYLVSIEHSSNITIKNLTFHNSPSWTLHPMESDNILIDGVSVYNPADSPNTDGLDPESCSDIRIVNSLFDVGDDCIAIKAGTEATAKKSPCKNIIISNCNMKHGHGGVVIGSEMSGDVENVVINNCVFFQTDRGIRLKTRRGRGGTVSDIAVSNIVMTDTLCPIVINSYYFCGPSGKEKYVWDKDKYPVDARTPIYKRFTFSNIIAKNVKSAAMFVYGLPEMPVEDLSINSLQVYMDPDASPIEPAMIADAPKLSQSGIFIENTANVSISNTTVTGANTELFEHNLANDNLQVK